MERLEIPQETRNYFRVVTENEVQKHLNRYGLIDNRESTWQFFESVFTFWYDTIEKIEESTKALRKHYVDVADKRHVITLTNKDMFISFKEYESVRVRGDVMKIYLCHLYVDFTGKNWGLLEFLSTIPNLDQAE
jgi:hypothetical protein